MAPCSRYKICSLLLGLITECPWNIRLGIYVRCYILPPETSSTGCMHVKKSNTHMLYIFEIQERYVFFTNDRYSLSIVSDFYFGYHLSLGICCPRNGFGQLAKRQLNLLSTLQHLLINKRKVRLVPIQYRSN